MTWNTFSRDPFQVQDRQIWPVFVDSLAQRQIKNQNTDTVWKTSKARLKHPPCIKTFLHKNNHKVANSYFPTWWDQLQPGINLDMCGADCGTAFRESIKLEWEIQDAVNQAIEWSSGWHMEQDPHLPQCSPQQLPSSSQWDKAGCSLWKYWSFTWVSPWYKWCLKF